MALKSILALAVIAFLQSCEGFVQPSIACGRSRAHLSRFISDAPHLVMCSDTVTEPADAPIESAAADEDAGAQPAGKPRRSQLEDLSEGEVVEGKIRSVMTYGAFVDIGASTDGLLHVSEISNEFVKDANEKLSVGDTVSCKIKSINLEKKQLALTCKEPSAGGGRQGGGGRKRADLSAYSSADPKTFLSGKVASITDYGAFVTLEEGVDGLVHISAIQEGGVGKVSDVLSVGKEVQVRVISFDESKRRIGLSMIPYVEGEEAKPQGGRREKGGRGDRSSSFGDDSAFQMTEEELQSLEVTDGEFVSPFDAAFKRAEKVQTAKEKKEKYMAPML